MARSVAGLELGLSGSDATQAARTAVNIAKTAADLTGNRGLESVPKPVLSLLNTTQKQVVPGNADRRTQAPLFDGRQ